MVGSVVMQERHRIGSTVSAEIVTTNKLKLKLAHSYTVRLYVLIIRQYSVVQEFILRSCILDLCIQTLFGKSHAHAHVSIQDPQGFNHRRITVTQSGHTTYIGTSERLYCHVVERRWRCSRSLLLL